MLYHMSEVHVHDEEANAVVRLVRLSLVPMPLSVIVIASANCSSSLVTLETHNHAG